MGAFAAVAAGTQIAGAVMSLVSMIGRGCGEVCIDASKVEQIYEAAADNISAVAHAGMLDGATAAQLIQQLAAEADAAEAQLGTKQAGAGASNASKVIQAEAAAVEGLGPATQPLDLNQAQSHYIQPGTPGWYPDALPQAAQLTNEVLQSMAPFVSSSPGTGGSPAMTASPAAVATSAAGGSTGGMTTLLLWGGAGVVALKLFGVI